MVTDKLDHGALSYATNNGNFGIDFVRGDRDVTLYVNDAGIGLWDNVEAIDIWRIRPNQ